MMNTKLLAQKRQNQEEACDQACCRGLPGKYKEHDEAVKQKILIGLPVIVDGVVKQQDYHRDKVVERNVVEREEIAVVVVDADGSPSLVNYCAVDPFAVNELDVNEGREVNQGENYSCGDVVPHDASKALRTCSVCRRGRASAWIGRRKQQREEQRRPIFFVLPVRGKTPEGC